MGRERVSILEGEAGTFFKDDSILTQQLLITIVTMVQVIITQFIGQLLCVYFRCVGGAPWLIRFSKSQHSSSVF